MKLFVYFEKDIAHFIRTKIEKMRVTAYSKSIITYSTILCERLWLILSTFVFNMITIKS